MAGMLPNTVLRVVLEPLGVYLGLRLVGDLAGGWYGLAVGDMVGGLFFLVLLLWRLRVYVRASDWPTGATPAPARRT